MSKKLTEKDVSEGKELYWIIEHLSAEEKKQVLIYIRALVDRQIMTSDKKAE